MDRTAGRTRIIELFFINSYNIDSTFMIIRAGTVFSLYYANSYFHFIYGSWMKDEITFNKRNIKIFYENQTKMAVQLLISERTSYNVS